MLTELFACSASVPGSQMLVFCLQKITKINDIKRNNFYIKGMCLMLLNTFII